jgi:lauroyl/myristoyl acyltransferase
MLYSEIIAVCSQILTKRINSLCGQNVELFNVKLAVHIVTTKLAVHIVTTILVVHIVTTLKGKRYEL